MPEATDHFQGRHYAAEHTTRPFSALNPTKRYIAVDKPESGSGAAAQKHPGAVYVWRSRDNRKGRHGVAIDPEHRDENHVAGQRLSESWLQTSRGLAKMVLDYPIWDVSYDVAVVFSIGSIIWVFNAFFAWLPLAAPSTEFAGESSWGGGLTGLIGATVFELGSVLLMLEAVNENRSDCFGWAVETGLDGLLKLHKESECDHHHTHKRSFLKGQAKSEDPNGGNADKNSRKWSWWPTWYEVRTHYIRDIGFLACSSQMLGATIFWIAGFTGLPPILNSLSIPAQNGIYWLPQVVGGVGFIVSGVLFMIEVQPRWYIPAPRVLGWHIGFWNLIGAIGFTLCGALGFGSSDPAVEYAVTMSTFVGSWAFLLGSLIQWFESLSKYPIWVDKNVRKYSDP